MTTDDAALRAVRDLEAARGELSRGVRVALEAVVFAIAEHDRYLAGSWADRILTASRIEIGPGDEAGWRDLRVGDRDDLALLARLTVDPAGPQLVARIVVRGEEYDVALDIEMEDPDDS